MPQRPSCASPCSRKWWKTSGVNGGRPDAQMTAMACLQMIHLTPRTTKPTMATNLEQMAVEIIEQAQREPDAATATPMATTAATSAATKKKTKMHTTQQPHHPVAGAAPAMAQLNPNPNRKCPSPHPRPPPNSSPRKTTLKIPSLSPNPSPSAQNVSAFSAPRWAN